MNTILADLLNGMLVSAALASAIWLALRLTPRTSLNAATRYAIWWAVLAVTSLHFRCTISANQSTVCSSIIFGEPAISLSCSHAPAPRTPESRHKRTQPLTAIRAGPAAPTRCTFLPPPCSIPTFPIAISAGPWPARIVALWFVSAFLMLIRLLASAILLERRKARSSDAPQPLAAAVAQWIATCGGSNRRIRLATSREISVPLVAGPRRTTILLPARLLDELTEHDLEQIGIHEAAHLVRRDDYALLIQRTLEAIFVLHPVAYWISRRIDLEREVACDDYVIAATGDSRPYAACLARVVQLSGGVRPVPVAAAARLKTVRILQQGSICFLDHTRHTGTRLLGLRLAMATTCITAFAPWGSAQLPRFIAFRTAAIWTRALRPTRTRGAYRGSADFLWSKRRPTSPPNSHRFPLSPPAAPTPATPAIHRRPRLVPPRFSTGPTRSTRNCSSGFASGNCLHSRRRYAIPVVDSAVTGLDQKRIPRCRKMASSRSFPNSRNKTTAAQMYSSWSVADVNLDPALQPLLRFRIESADALRPEIVVQVHGLGQLSPGTSPVDAVRMIRNRLSQISQKQAAVIVTNSGAAPELYQPTRKTTTALSNIDMPVYVLDIYIRSCHPSGGALLPHRFLSELGALARQTGGQYMAL